MTSKGEGRRVGIMFHKPKSFFGLSHASSSWNQGRWEPTRSSNHFVCAERYEARMVMHVLKALNFVEEDETVSRDFPIIADQQTHYGNLMHFRYMVIIRRKISSRRCLLR